MENRKEKQCYSVIAGLSLVVRESLGIVKHLLVTLARVVIFVPNAVRHMWTVRKSSWSRKSKEEIQYEIDARFFSPGHILPFIGEWIGRKDWSICDGTDGRPDLRHRVESFKEQYYIYKWDEFKQNQEKENQMNINDFAVKVAKKEGGKKSVNIAQIKEILKVVNVLLKGEFYKLIRKIK